MQRNYADTLPLTLFIAFHAGAQATGAINNVVHLQNQLGTTLPLRFISATKPPSSRLRSNLPENSQRAEQELSRRGFIIVGLAARCVLSLPIVQVSGRKGRRTGRGRLLYRRAEAPAVNEDADATLITGCQHESSYQASSSDPWKGQGTLLLGYCHKVEKEELLSKVNRLREIEHHYNDEAEEWFGKYMKYKRHEETTIASLLQRHFPLSNIARYNLAQDRIIYH